jgi:hypothetical protein
MRAVIIASVFAVLVVIAERLLEIPRWPALLIYSLGGLHALAQQIGRDL